MSGLDHDKRIQIRDRVARIGQPILISVVIMALVITSALSVVLYKVVTDYNTTSTRSSNNHHAATAKQNATIIAQNKDIERLVTQISSLQQQHSSDVTSTAQLVQEINAEQQELAAAEAKLSTAGTYIGQWDAWAASIIAPLCALSANPSCPAPPVPPPGL